MFVCLCIGHQFGASIQRSSPNLVSYFIRAVELI